MGVRKQGKDEAGAAQVLADAQAVQDAGAFAVVLELIPDALAAEVTAALSIPTIGIGASAGCDGQILVVDDMLGLFEWTPRFVRRYADARGLVDQAAAAFAADVRAGTFPGTAETYKLSQEDK